MNTLAASPSAMLLPPSFNRRVVAALAVLLASVAAFLLTGCASVTQTATTTTTATNGLVTVTVARSSIVAVGDARAIVDKVRASAGKTSSVGVSGVSEDTTTTNIYPGVAEIIAAAIHAAKTP